MPESKNILLIALDGDHYSQAHLDTLRENAPELKVFISQDEQEIKEVIEQIVIAVGSVPPNLIKQMSNLRWLQQWSAGADWLQDYPEVAHEDFVLTNASGVHSIPISEHVIAFLLAFGRGFPQTTRYQTQAKWQAPDADKVFELAGKTMLLLGVGAIGARTARVASALGVHVIGIRRDPSDDEAGIEEMHSPDDIMDLLPNADLIVSTVPYTKETQDMLGEEEFAAMKESAIVVNIGRGETIDQSALIHALEGGKIAGAALDVFETEPLPHDSPLWQMENVMITPHSAGSSPKYDQRAWEIFFDNLNRYRSGETLRNVVEKQLGY